MNLPLPFFLKNITNLPNQVLPQFWLSFAILSS